MSFEALFPVWSKLTTAQQDVIRGCISRRSVKKGTILHNGSGDCAGILLIAAGQLRAYITSEEGREITVYRLFEQDVCLFSAPCMMPSLQFELTIVTEKDTDFWLIPPSAYKALMTESAPLANYTNEIMASRVSEIMWLVEQVMWKSMDKRVADFLLEESNIEGTAADHPRDRRQPLRHPPGGGHPYAEISAKRGGCQADPRCHRDHR